MPEPLVFHLDLDRLNERSATLIHLDGEEEEASQVTLVLNRDPWKSLTRPSRVRITVEKLDA